MERVCWTDDIIKRTIDHGLEDRGWYLKWCEVEALGNHSTIKMKPLFASSVMNMKDDRNGGEKKGG